MNRPAFMLVLAFLFAGVSHCGENPDPNFVLSEIKEGAAMCSKSALAPFQPTGWASKFFEEHGPSLLAMAVTADTSLHLVADDTTFTLLRPMGNDFAVRMETVTGFITVEYRELRAPGSVWRIAGSNAELAIRPPHGAEEAHVNEYEQRCTSAATAHAFRRSILKHTKTGATISETHEATVKGNEYSFFLRPVEVADPNRSQVGGRTTILAGAACRNDVCTEIPDAEEAGLMNDRVLVSLPKEPPLPEIIRHLVRELNE